MPDDLPLLNGLRSFVEAGRELSFSRAAERLNVTPGAVSRLVRKLEEQLGVRLLERTAHGLVLTEQGALYHREVVGPLSAVAAATRRLVRGRQPNRVVVACYPTFAARWLLPRWSRFFDRHPEIDVQLATSLSDVDLLRDDSIDLAIRLGAPAELRRPLPGLVRHRLLPIEIAPVAAPGVLRGRGEAQRLQQLAARVLIHSRPLPGEWRHWLRACGDASGDPALQRALAAIEADRGPEFETLNLAVQAAMEGIGVAVAILAFVADDLAAGRLVLPFACRRRSGRDFHVVARTGRPNSRAVERYLRWLREEAGQLGSSSGSSSRKGRDGAAGSASG
ncbi:MAG: LysR substrate-binding domain-containing protein [Reyranellaceae bacterium]